MDYQEIFNKLFSFNRSSKCPSCGLYGELKKCPKCGRDACDKCVAFDNSDCMFCGYHGDIAKEMKMWTEKNK